LVANLQTNNQKVNILELFLTFVSLLGLVDSLSFASCSFLDAHRPYGFSLFGSGYHTVSFLPAEQKTTTDIHISQQGKTANHLKEKI
jgi:hypothetical protein